MKKAKISAETRGQIACVRRYLRKLEGRKLAILVRHYRGEKEALSEYSPMLSRIREVEQALCFLIAYGDPARLSRAEAEVVNAILSGQHPVIQEPYPSSEQVPAAQA